MLDMNTSTASDTVTTDGEHTSVARNGHGAIGRFLQTHLEEVAPEGFPLVRSGLITAQMEVIDGGVTFHGPLSFDEEVIASTGTWSFGIDSNDDDEVSDALTNAYGQCYAAWCERKDAERARKAMLSGRSPQVKRSPQVPMHTPCPSLWAGR